jgi:hypothetical protein
VPLTADAILDIFREWGQVIFHDSDSSLSVASQLNRYHRLSSDFAGIATFLLHYFCINLIRSGLSKRIFFFKFGLFPCSIEVMMECRC